MDIMAVFCTALLGLAMLLILTSAFFIFLKYIKKRFYPKWKFPDYASVGYAEYLYHKFIRRDLEQ